MSLLDSDYYKDMFGVAAMRAVFGEERRFTAWLETEAALARVQARLGLIPETAGEGITAAAKLESLDLPAMKQAYEKVGFPILPLVKQLSQACDPETARYVHWGATTQDIVDTGLALQMQEGFAIVEDQLGVAIRAVARLAAEHRDTVMAGRTFQQQAAPITFGFKAAVWLDELLRHRERLPDVKRRALVCQFGGAVGTLATLGEHGIAVRSGLSRELGLEDPYITWHTARDGWAEAVFWLAMLASTLAKIATEIATLMRTEVDEVREPFETGRGGSSTMPQKRNPIACPIIIAIGNRLREHVGSQLGAMIQEHERGVGAMPIEWMVIPETFMLTAGSLKQAVSILDDLTVDGARMRRNLDHGGGLLLAEAVMMGLAPQIGRNQAHEVVYGAAGLAIERGMTLRDALLMEPAVTSRLSEAEIDALMEPGNYTGCAGAMVDDVLARARACGGVE